MSHRLVSHQKILGAGIGLHPKTRVAQDGRDNLADDIVVIHHEHGLIVHRHIWVFVHGSKDTPKSTVG